MKKKIALFSLYNLDRAEGFARRLIKLGWQIICSRETYRLLSRKGIPAVNIADFLAVKQDYGFPPTLHPKIESCLTSPKGPRIDLVYVLPYPLSVGNDIGGRTLLALAAKGKRLPVMSIDDMEEVIRGLENKKMEGLRESLINKANALIASHYDDLLKDRSHFDLLAGSFQYALLNGENPYQVPAGIFSVKGNDALSLHNFRRIGAEAPCFTNLADMDSILQTMCLMAGAFKKRYGKYPYICIAAKHGNACGAAMSWNSASEAITKALFGNPKSIWGGEVIVNFAIDGKLAALLYNSEKRKQECGDSAWMLDVMLAPGFSSKAIKVLGQRKQRKLFVNKALLSASTIPAKYAYRFVRGGFLRQPPHSYVIDYKNALIIGKKMDTRVIDSLIIAWSVAWSSNQGGNEIAIVNDRQLIGVGGGASTVEAARIAVSRAKNCRHNIRGGVFAANAFFPFTDAPELLAGQVLLREWCRGEAKERI